MPVSRSVFPVSYAAGVAAMLLVALAACDREDPAGEQVRDYGLAATTEIIVTSEAGERLAVRDNVQFAHGRAAGTVIEIDPEATRQTLLGIGSSFTESSAFVLAHLDPEARAEVMSNIYGEDGANFSLARTTIGSTDFSVEGRYRNCIRINAACWTAAVEVAVETLGRLAAEQLMT